MLLHTNGLTLLIIFLSILLSMSLHEATHAFVAHWLGDSTAEDLGRLTLNPLKHIDLFTTILLPMVLILLGTTPIFIAKPVPFNPSRVKYGEYGSALIGISGPFSNLLLAIIASILLKFVHGAQFSNAVSIFIYVNVAFFIFNMIPFPPLDGSRLLYAFAPEFLQDIMLRIESTGLVGILLFMFILFPVIIPIVSTLSQSIINWLAMLAT